jgi:hypothetical protein
MPPLPTSPYRLLVEGADDFHSVIHLLARHGYGWDDASTVRPYVQSLGGIEPLFEALPIALKGPYERLGVVFDANLGLSNRWAQIRGLAQRVGIAIPDVLANDGAIVAGLRPGSRIGFWFMPDNSSPGSLENFLGKLVPKDDPIWAYADEAAFEARRRGGRCPEKEHVKSALHTWLAWQEEPGLPFGTALRARIFLHESEDALRFVGWFRRLFIEP